MVRAFFALILLCCALALGAAAISASAPLGAPLRPVASGTPTSAASPTSTSSSTSTSTRTQSSTPTRYVTATPTPEPRETLPAGVAVQQVSGVMSQPVSMAFDPAGRLFIAERGGAVRLMVAGVLQPSPVITFNVDTCLERGLVGVAVDPAFAQNHYVYVQYTTFSYCTQSLSSVTRFVEANGVGLNPTVIFTSTFTGPFHTGNNIHFGPDGKLYISTGDNYNAANGQNVTVRHAKMHRLNPDGSIPPDNPVFTQTGALPSLFAIGLRNSFDFTFDTVVTGRIFASENGPSCDDEMNRVAAGWNYGWRVAYPCDDQAPGGPDPAYNTIPPLWSMPRSACCVSPTGIEVYSGTMIPEWQHSLFMCSFNDAALRRFYLSDDRLRVTGVSVIEGVECNVDLETGPDGALYYVQAGGKYPGSVMRLSRSLSPAPSPSAVPSESSTASPTTGLTATATATTTATPGPPPCSLRFADVPPGHTFYSYVQCLACRGIFGGYPCGGPGEPCNANNDPYFRPGNNVTRGQLSKIVSNAAGFAEPTGFTLFEDVPEPTSPFFIWVQRLANRGILGGYQCGGAGEPCVPPANRPYFRPGNEASRGQIAKIVSNAAGFSEPPGAQRFEDVPPGHTFYTYTQRLAARGAISGYPCGGAGEPCVAPLNRPYFRPRASATRGQIAKIVAQAFYPACVTR